MTVRSEMVCRDRRADLTVCTAVEVEAEAEADLERGGWSPDEMESPRSVTTGGVRWRKGNRKIENVHSQVLRIREEDLCVGKDLGEGLSCKDKISWGGGGGAGVDQYVAAPTMHVVLFSRPILPCSPLSGKSTVRALN